MTLIKKIKDVLEPGDTAPQLRDKICEKYHGFFVKKVEQKNGNVKEAKEQIQAEIGRVMVYNKQFNIVRMPGQLNTYSLKQKSKKPPKELTTLSARIKKLETDYRNLYKSINAEKKAVKPIKKRSWWSRWIKRKK